MDRIFIRAILKGATRITDRKELRKIGAEAVAYKVTKSRKIAKLAGEESRFTWNGVTYTFHYKINIWYKVNKDTRVQGLVKGSTITWANLLSEAAKKFLYGKQEEEEEEKEEEVEEGVFISEFTDLLKKKIPTNPKIKLTVNAWAKFAHEVLLEKAQEDYQLVEKRPVEVGAGSVRILQYLDLEGLHELAFDRGGFLYKRDNKFVLFKTFDEMRS